MRTKRENRRYYLHRMIRKKGIRYSPTEHTVYWGWNHDMNDIHVAQLQQEYSYSIQTEIQ
ncbi:hypothetical protein [Aquimarina algiphila]|uniref:Uncharacterized protein n=1 Tax=Aquimarina algiphila TaxID=2047982 RepID=A0A554VAA1_9FLAO|nr:hypothetical protein [Aquimarina algiphila]TSE02806.1 hypothetical protein FOF46_30450 [Aquimarina algiphila]